MKRVVILNTWISDTNTGNRIIVEAAHAHLRGIFPNGFFYELPSAEYIETGRTLIAKADHVFLAGTNILSHDMDRTSDWKIKNSDRKWMKNVILLGVGWWQYQTMRTNRFTRKVLESVLHPQVVHCVRDEFTAKQLRQMGFLASNCGCPSLWGLTEEHCATIRKEKSNNVLVTFTEYNQKPTHDKILADILCRNYNTIYGWPQQFGDHEYLRQMLGERYHQVDPSLEALDQLLSSGNVDYVGTRLHAGVRALQHSCRTVIVTVDNRAQEMGKDFGLPIIQRDRLMTDLEHLINSVWATRVRMDFEAIAAWKSQFSTTDVVS